MKKYLLPFIASLVCVALSACTSDTIPTETTLGTVPTETIAVEETTEHTQPAPSYDIPLIAFSAPSVMQEYSEDGVLLFTYTSQDMKLTLEDPQVANSISLELVNLVDFPNTTAPSVLAAARAAYSEYDWTPYSCSIFYSPKRLDSAVLSLYGTQVISNGNPRPMVTNSSMTFDLLTGRMLSLPDILNPDYSADLLSGLIIAALDTAAQDGILYSDYGYVISEMFATNTPVECWYLSDEGICFYFAPYEIAPYSAGTVTATVSYSELTELLREEYFPVEQVELTGTPTLIPFHEADVPRFLSFAELILDPDGTEYLLYAEGAIANVCIEKGLYLADGSFVSEHTAFTAASLTDSTALMLQLDPQDLGNLRLSYYIGSTQYHVSLASMIS